MSAVSAKLLQDAVHQDRLMSREGLLQRLFSLWFNGFVYNQIWEDPRVDLAALQLTPESRILTIASGGCNILNYLVEQPAAIVAVDLNPYHMYLTRLKLASLAHLPHYEDFFNFFGKADTPENIENYHRYVGDRLDEETRAFWEHSRLAGKPRINYFANNFYSYTRSGYFLRFAHWLARLIGYDAREFLKARDQVEQQRLFEQTVSPFFDHWLIKGICRLSFVVFSLGIPPQQYRAMEQEAGGRIENLFRERVRKLTCDFPLSENYFTWQALDMRYDLKQRQALPAYLWEENYHALKGNLHRVETHVASMIDYLKEQPDNSLDRFVLLDAQDWMKPHVIVELWQEIARVGKPGSRIIFRTAGSESPVESALPPGLKVRFDYQEALSNELFQQDRSAIYGGFHVYTMKDKE